MRGDGNQKCLSGQDFCPRVTWLSKMLKTVKGVSIRSHLNRYLYKEHLIALTIAALKWTICQRLLLKIKRRRYIKILAQEVHMKKLPMDLIFIMVDYMEANIAQDETSNEPILHDTIPNSENSEEHA